MRLLSLAKSAPPILVRPLINLSLNYDGRKYAFNSESVSGVLQKVLGPSVEAPRTLRAATEAEIQGLLAQDVSTGSKFLVEWMRNPQSRKEVSPEALGDRVTRLLRVAIRPEGFLRKAADQYPSVRRPALAAASVIDGLRSMGFDVRLPKSKATAETIGAEVAEVTGGLNDAMPILVGQMNTGLNFSGANSGQTGYALLRDLFKGFMSAKGLAERNGLTVTPKQGKALQGWVDRRARFLATETASFLKTRDPSKYPEKMTTFVDAMLSDLVDSGVLPAEEKPGLTKLDGWRFLP